MADIPPPHRPSNPTPTIVNGWCEMLMCNADAIPFQHRGWHNMRMRVLRAMRETKQPYSREFKFCDCGGEVHVYEHTATGEVLARGSRCEDRFCVTCGQKRSRQIADSLRKLLEREPAMFITITVRGRPGDSLAGQITKLSEGWKTLRRLPLWRESIAGGAIMLEVKWSKTSGGHWHPHYHLLCHGHWIDQERLRAAWYAITGDSDQVNVQRVAEIEKSLGYVTKYASKCVDASFVMKPGLLREAMVALRGKRLCACFGSWHGTPLREKLEPERDEHGDLTLEVSLTSWVYRGTVASLRMHAESGQSEAADLLRRLERQRALRSALDQRCRGPSTVCDPIAAAAIDATSLAFTGS